MSTGTIYGVSLGPGDPELITLKGYRALTTADRIYYPASQHNDGSVTSYARSILHAYDLSDDRLVAIPLKMSADRTAAEISYDTAFEAIRADQRAGRDVAIVSEGDITFYSTFAYLLERILKHELPLELVAGVPSFVLGACERKIALCSQNEKVAILPRITDPQVLERALNAFETVVLMKIRSIFPMLGAILANKPVQVVYCERLGTSEQFITTNWQEIAKREPPYFSLLILKRTHEA
jgi:precorrin-2/cobalt-factor-2 C20-methyltransferase